MAGVFSGAIRFLCHLPLGYYCVNAIGNWYFVRDHAALLLKPPLSSKILVGEQFAGSSGAFAFAWNIIMWVPTIRCPESLLVYLGVVDSLIVMALIVATGIEGTYVGKTKHECAQVPPNGTADPNLIFFERARAINETNPNYGEEVCKDFMAKFYVGIAMVIMYGISAACNLGIGIPALRKEPQYRGQCTMSTPSGWWHCMWAAATFPFAYPWTLILKIATFLFELLPNRVQHALAFAHRYAGKRSYHMKTTQRFKLRQLSRLSHTRVPKTNETDKALANVLLYHEIILRVAPHVHYVDLINLSLISKQIRVAVFPALGTNDQDRQLRLYSCSGNKKSDCWGCGIQICNECSATRRCRTTTVAFHMKYCQVRCTKCYYSMASFQYFNARNRYGYSDRCSCQDGRNPNYNGGRTYNRVNDNTYADRGVCGDCNKLEGAALQALREKRDRHIHIKLVQQPLACAKCAEALPRKGPLWWVCSNCEVECGSHDHPGWGRKLEV